MSSKGITIVTLYKATSHFLLEELKKILRDAIPITFCSFEDSSIEAGISSDLVLIPDPCIFEEVKDYVKEGQEILVLRRTLHQRGFKELLELEQGTRAMLVNVTPGMSLETISLIYQLGVRHIQLTPVYPGLDTIPPLDLAITPGEISYVPKGVKKIIDIGNRVLDISSIMDILMKLKLNHLLGSKPFLDYLDSIVPVSLGLEKMMGRSHQLESQLEMLLKLLEVGIIMVNVLGVIISFNESAAKILKMSCHQVLGKRAKEVFPSIPFTQVLKTARPLRENLIKVKGIDIVLTANPVLYQNSLHGALAVIKRFSDVEKKQHEFRSQLINKGHVAHYSFHHIIGQSQGMAQCKEIAKRMATSNSTILIMGESGTGKELFAQAIHNYSNRKQYQFVVVNCAALPESLLESELFGYEEGAFTGARKEGKPGLFELAHEGTLFLDEIGEMPLNLQARLLRVLEEREVMRIGGDQLIHVDVRIIAATNSDLKGRVKGGEFRQDLYYRLNILPLRVPPLRKRKEDIHLLIDALKKVFKADFNLTEKVKEVFLKHKWEGNVRELRNYIEYFANLKKDLIKLKDLPFTLEEEGREEDPLPLDPLKEKLGDDARLLFILEELAHRFKEKRRAGRRSIAQAAASKGLYLSEQEVRRSCHTLAQYSLVTVGKGGEGTRITSYGLQVLGDLKSG